MLGFQHYCVDYVILIGRQMLKLASNVEYLLIFLTVVKFCNLEHLQDIKLISFELRHPYKSDFNFF